MHSYLLGAKRTTIDSTEDRRLSCNLVSRTTTPRPLYLALRSSFLLRCFPCTLCCEPLFLRQYPLSQLWRAVHPAMSVPRMDTADRTPHTYAQASSAGTRHRSSRRTCHTILEEELRTFCGADFRTDDDAGGMQCKDTKSIVPLSSDRAP